MDIDVYRRQARQAAWYDPDDRTRFNPFAVRRPLQHCDDVEDVIRSSTTEAARRRRDAESRSHSSAFTDPQDIRRSSLALSHPELSDAQEAKVGDGAVEKNTDEKGSTTSDNQVINVSVSHARRRRVGFLNRLNKSFGTTESDVSKQSPKQIYTTWSQVQPLLFNSWLHLLFLFVPAGFAVNYCHVNSIIVFCINFIAIIPSAMDLSLAVDELSLRTGELLEGLISMTFR